MYQNFYRNIPLFYSFWKFIPFQSSYYFSGRTSRKTSESRLSWGEMVRNEHFPQIDPREFGLSNCYGQGPWRQRGDLRVEGRFSGGKAPHGISSSIATEHLDWSGWFFMFFPFYFSACAESFSVFLGNISVIPVFWNITCFFYFILK